jgi:hypothetical protein
VTRTPLSTFFTSKHARCRACDLTSLFPVEQLSHGRARRLLQRSQEPRLFLRQWHPKISLLQSQHSKYLSVRGDLEIAQMRQCDVPIKSGRQSKANVKSRILPGG